MATHKRSRDIVADHEDRLAAATPRPLPAKSYAAALPDRPTLTRSEAMGGVALAEQALRESIAKGLEMEAEAARKAADEHEDAPQSLLAVEARTLGIIAARVRAGEWG